MTVPTLLYVVVKSGHKNDCKLIEAVEMQFFRSVARYALRDGKRNDDINKELSMFSINRCV